MTSHLRAGMARWLIILICFVPLAACGEDEAEKARKAKAERDAQLQAEQVARSAQESRTAWVAAIGGGACAGCLLIGLLGIHIGSRALKRSGKEAKDG